MIESLTQLALMHMSIKDVKINWINVNKLTHTLLTQLERDGVQFIRRESNNAATCKDNNVAIVLKLLKKGIRSEVSTEL